MLWSNNLNRLTGYVMILLAVCLVLGIAFSLGVSDQDPAERAEVEQFLIDVEDSQGLAIISSVFFILIDAVVGLVLTALLYLLFRDRSRFLSLLVLVAFLANAAAAMVFDATNAGLIVIADSYVNGGVGLAAGDPAFLDLAHVVAIVGGITSLLSFTALGIALLALGLIIRFAPEGRVNPPRIYGSAAMLAALTAFLSWVIVVSDMGFLFFAVQGILSIVVLIGVGAHLIMNPDDEAADSPAAA